MKCDRCGYPRENQLEEAKSQDKMLTFYTSCRERPEDRHFEIFPHWPQGSKYNWTLCENCYNELIEIEKKLQLQFLAYLTHPKIEVKTDKYQENTITCPDCGRKWDTDQYCMCPTCGPGNLKIKRHECPICGKYLYTRNPLRCVKDGAIMEIPKPKGLQGE